MSCSQRTLHWSTTSPPFPPDAPFGGPCCAFIIMFNTFVLRLRKHCFTISRLVIILSVNVWYLNQHSTVLSIARGRLRIVWVTNTINIRLIILLLLLLPTASNLKVPAPAPPDPPLTDSWVYVDQYHGFWIEITLKQTRWWWRYSGYYYFRDDTWWCFIST